MNTITIKPGNNNVVVFVDKKVSGPIELMREAIKVLSKEVIKYEHGINPDIYS